MGLIQRLGLFSILFRIWQNLEKVCQDSFSVILKSKCKLRKCNLQSWFIYTQLKGSFMLWTSWTFSSTFQTSPDFLQKNSEKISLKPSKYLRESVLQFWMLILGKFQTLKTYSYLLWRWFCLTCILFLQKVITEVIVVITKITPVDFYMQTF